MKGICFFSITYIILVNPYLIGTVAHQCISQIDINNEYSFSIAKLPSSSEPTESIEDIEQVEKQDNDYFLTLYQLAATKACYESCSSNNNNKAQIMTYSNEYIQSKSSPLTILDRHYSQLSNNDFLKPNEVYLVKYSDINNEGGSSGLGCFELDDNSNINHYSIDHSICKKAKSVICGEKIDEPSLFQSTSLNTENEENKPMKYTHLKHNIKLNQHHHHSSSSKRNKKHHPKKHHPKTKQQPKESVITGTNTTMPTINNDDMDPERKGNTNLTNIEIQSGKNNNDNNVNKKRSLTSSSSSSSFRKYHKNMIQHIRKRKFYNKKKAVIDHYRKNTEQLKDQIHEKNNTHDKFTLYPIEIKNLTSIDSGIHNTNDSFTSSTSTTSLSMDTNINKLNKTNIYQVNENNHKEKEEINKEENDFSIIRLPNAIESTTSATEVCQQQFEENHLGTMKNTSKDSLLHRRLYSSYGNMVISSWNHQDQDQELNDYNTKSHKECLMYTAKDNGIRFAPCSEANTILCVKSLNEFLVS